MAKSPENPLFEARDDRILSLSFPLSTVAKLASIVVLNVMYEEIFSHSYALVSVIRRQGCPVRRLNRRTVIFTLNDGGVWYRSSRRRNSIDTPCSE